MLQVKASIGIALFSRSRQGAHQTSQGRRPRPQCRQERRPRTRLCLRERHASRGGEPHRLRGPKWRPRSAPTGSFRSTSPRSTSRPARSSGSKPWPAGSIPSGASSHPPSSRPAFQNPALAAKIGPGDRAAGRARYRRLATPGPVLRSHRHQPVVLLFSLVRRHAGHPDRSCHGRRVARSRWRSRSRNRSSWMKRRRMSAISCAGFREAGIKISLDDFGTGYASLTHLKQFSVDAIKIDRSFIRDLEADPQDAAHRFGHHRPGHRSGARHRGRGHRDGGPGRDAAGLGLPPRPGSSLCQADGGLTRPLAADPESSDETQGPCRTVAPVGRAAC